MPLRDAWNWDDWEPGDTCIWEDDSDNEGPFVLTSVDHIWGRCFWIATSGELCMTRETNLIRVLKQGRELTRQDLLNGGIFNN